MAMMTMMIAVVHVSSASWPAPGPTHLHLARLTLKLAFLLLPPLLLLLLLTMTTMMMMTMMMMAAWLRVAFVECGCEWCHHCGHPIHHHPCCVPPSVSAGRPPRRRQCKGGAIHQRCGGLVHHQTARIVRSAPHLFPKNACQPASQPARHCTRQACWSTKLRLSGRAAVNRRQCAAQCDATTNKYATRRTHERDDTTTNHGVGGTWPEWQKSADQPTLQSWACSSSLTTRHQWQKTPVFGQC